MDPIREILGPAVADKVAHVGPNWGLVLEVLLYTMLGIGLSCLLSIFVLRRRENEVFHALGIRTTEGEYPYLMNKRKMEDGTSYVVSVPDGVDMKKMCGGTGDGKDGKYYHPLRQAYGDMKRCEIKPIDGNKLSIRTFTSNLKSHYDFDPAWIQDGELMRIPIGQSLHGMEYITLCDNSAHVLIGGTTGSGKSTAINIIAAYLAAHPAPASLYLIDLKGGVELGGYERCAKVKMFAKTEADAARMIGEIVAEMNHRYELLAVAGVRNIRDYDGIMRRLVLVIDEYADLYHNKSITEHLVQIALKGRAAGVHMVIALQRPDVQTIDSRIKACLTTCLCFRVKLPQNSVVILGHGGAENLRGKGHALYERDGREVEMQGYYLSDAAIDALIAPTFVDRPKQTDDTSGVLQ